jgi:hypothetical protein
MTEIFINFVHLTGAWKPALGTASYFT